jgi:hypothetical protein
MEVMHSYGLNGSLSHKKATFITTAVGISNPTLLGIDLIYVA